MIISTTTPQERMNHTARLERLEMDLIELVAANVKQRDQRSASTYAEIYRDIRVGRTVK